MRRMTTSRLSNGSHLQSIGLGTWRSAPGEVGAAVTTAIEIGYRHIDCAAIYGNEAEIGVALEQCGVPRAELWITSKLWNDSHAAVDVKPALEKTLADLRLDYLDLYLIHWPIVQKPGVVIPESGADFVSLDVTPVAETWGAMEAVADAGLARGIGVSNFSVHKLERLLKDARIPPSVNQIEMHPYLQQPEMLAFCDAHDIHLTAYAPLGSENKALLEDAVVGAIAERNGCTPAQVLLRWGVQRGTWVIPKSVHRERLAQNLAAGDLTLSDDDMATLAGLDRAHRFVDGSFWVHEGGPYTLANLWD
jgi:alcohol dehydrogenase (NADP+)